MYHWTKSPAYHVFLHIPAGSHLGYFLFMLIPTKPLQMSLDMSSLWTHIFISLGSILRIEISGSWGFRLFISFYNKTKTIARTLQKSICHDTLLPRRSATLWGLDPFSAQALHPWLLPWREIGEKRPSLCLHFSHSYHTIIVHLFQVSSCSLE